VTPIRLWVSNTRRRFLTPFPGLACLSILAAAGLAACDRGDKDAAGQVVVYCSVDQDLAQGILRDFEKQTGIRVLTRYDEEARKTTGLVQRLRAEASQPAADVFWSGEIFQTIRLAEEGVLTPYDGEGAKDRPPQFADPKGRWHAFALRQRVIAYSTRRIRPGEAPGKLEDLLDPRWKGRIIMAQPQFGTTGGDVASWFVHYGPQRARQILQGLKANEVRFVQGNSLAVRKVAQGEADVCMTDTDDVYAAQRNGWPVAMTGLDQGGAGALAIPNSTALVRGGPSPQAARRLVAFLLSAKVEAALAAGEAHTTPVRPVVPGRFPQFATGKALEVDYARVAEQMAPAMAAVEEIFR
jgi:iron(III) transport system substrate-binding protein